MTETIINITTPISDETFKTFKAGDMVHISGIVYTGRDAAHKKLIDALNNDEPMPFDFIGNLIFYAGPCPAKPDKPIGSIGPTTGGRMDTYSPTLINKGLKGMIGKGLRNKEVIDCIVKEGGVYFVAIGGAGSLIAKCIESVEIIAYEQLGTEAIRKLTVKNLPVIVGIDSYGNNIYTMGREQYMVK
jgi:fumarate hydratase subunit beta